LAKFLHKISLAFIATAV